MINVCGAMESVCGADGWIAMILISVRATSPIAMRISAFFILSGTVAASLVPLTGLSLTGPARVLDSHLG